MKAVVRVLKDTYESMDKFKETPIWSVINEVQEPADVTVEVVAGSNNKIAIVAKNDSDSAMDDVDTNVLEPKVGQKLREVTGRNGYVLKVLKFTDQSALDNWQTEFQS